MVRKAVTVKFAGAGRYVPSTVLSISVEKYRRTSDSINAVGFCSSVVPGTCGTEAGETLTVARLANCIGNGNPYKGVTISEAD